MRFIIILFCLLTTSCSDDGVKDKSIEKALAREAMCTVAAERFHLYDEAKKHYEHGIEVVRQSMRHNTDKSVHDEFKASLLYSRTYMSKMSKDYNVLFLAKNCDFKIKNFQFDQAG